LESEESPAPPLASASSMESGKIRISCPNRPRRIPGKLAVKPTLPVGISCQHAREVAVFTAPHKDRAAAHLCGALNSLQRYIRAARAGRDRCIPQCVRNISPQPSWLNLAPSPISCYWNASRFSVVDPLTQKRASSLSPGSSLFAD
jgi:hypothetical protein